MQPAVQVNGALGRRALSQTLLVVKREAAEHIADRDARIVLVRRDGTRPDIPEDLDSADCKAPDDLMGVR